MDPRTKLLLEAPIGPTLVRLAIPNIIVMFVQSLIGLIETYFVAKLGTDALAGMALVFPVLMLFQMISAGAMGGGILSAVARALGAGRTQDANDLVWYAAAIGVGMGLLTTIAVLGLGRVLYGAMGGREASLDAALTYSHIVFAGAVLFWLFNSLAAVIRATGNMNLPAIVISVGAVILIPLSPALIFGLGPFPALGIAGGAYAVVVYYAAGSAIFVFYLWSARGVLKPAPRPPRFAWAPLRDILRVGAAGSLVSLTTNITIGVTTGLAGAYGPAAVAGYGTGSRLEYLLVPLVFGLGAPLSAMVGTCIGAGKRERATQVAWTGALICCVLTETIGLAATLWPNAWLSLYGNDPQMLLFGTRYLHAVGPFYGFFGFGLALYFAAQGTGRMIWALSAGLLRLVFAVGGGILALQLFGEITGVFLAVGVGMAAFGLVNGFALASGAWLAHVPALGRTRTVAPDLREATAHD